MTAKLDGTLFVHDEPYELAWVFPRLDQQPPGVRIATTDDWGDERGAKDLAALELQIS